MPHPEHRDRRAGSPGAHTPGDSSPLGVLRSQMPKSQVKGPSPMLLPLSSHPNHAPSQGQGQVWSRPSSYTQPLLLAWKVARDSGSWCPAGQKVQGPRGPNSALQETRGGEKKKDKPASSSVTWRKRLYFFLADKQDYCIYPARRSLVKINGCELFLR